MPKLGKGLLSRVRNFRGHLSSDDRSRRGRYCRLQKSRPHAVTVGIAEQADEETELDEEMPAATRRQLQEEAIHSAFGMCGGGGSSRIVDGGLSGRQNYENVADEGVERQPSSYAAEMKLIRELRAQQIIDAQTEYCRKRKEQTEKAGDSFNEEDEMITYAKQQLLKTTSNANLMMTAELLIDESWLGNVDALPGNIYRLAVMGDIFVDIAGEAWQYQFQAIAKIFGVLSIVTIQLVSPPLIFLSRMKGDGVLDNSGYRWHCCPWHPSYDATSTAECFYNGTAAKDVNWHDDWHHIMSTKLLGMLMMATFILNGLFVVLEERHSWKQIYNTFRYLDVMNPRFKLAGRTFMYIDAMVNSWVISWCCIDVYLVIGASVSPSDVVLNALGLVFLYNLDDLGGDLGFVKEGDWPGLKLAWIHKEVVQPASLQPDVDFDENSMGRHGHCIHFLYNATLVLLVVLTVALPIVAAATPFIQIVPT